jgi:chemotaxis signal transduction protein
MEYFVFRVGEQHYGVEAHYVHRIVDDLVVTPVPLVPPCYEGLSYYRGELYDVVHAGIILGEKREVPQNGEPYVILTKWNQHNLGLVPDSIIGLKWIDEQNAEQTEQIVDDLSVKLITPEYIWELLSEMNYGPEKI